MSLVMKYLTDREYRVIRAFFWDGLPLEKIAKREGITREGARQIKEKAILKLRHTGRLLWLVRKFRLIPGLAMVEYECDVKREYMRHTRCPFSDEIDEAPDSDL